MDGTLTSVTTVQCFGSELESSPFGFGRILRKPRFAQDLVVQTRNTHLRALAAHEVAAVNHRGVAHRAAAGRQGVPHDEHLLAVEVDA